MSSAMNTQYRKHLAGTALDYFDTREAIDAIAPAPTPSCLTPRACWPSSWCAAASRSC